jgi:hypothetical protein
MFTETTKSFPLSCRNHGPCTVTGTSTRDYGPVDPFKAFDLKVSDQQTSTPEESLGSSTLRWVQPWPVSQGCNMRSTSSGFMKPCNSPCFAQLAAFFIELRTE